MILPFPSPLQHCELNSESEVRWGPIGALCFDGRGEKVRLSPCPSQRPPTSSLRWRFIKARTLFLPLLRSTPIRLVVAPSLLTG